jgi:hypothetical protein
MAVDFMKTCIISMSLSVAVGVALLGRFALAAAEAVPPGAADAAVTAKAPAVPTLQLSYGVGDVLKLSRAKVKDETIFAFIANSQSNYNLSAEEIIFLRSEGVSEQVVTRMLEHQKKATAAQAAVAVPAPNNPPASAVAKSASVPVQPVTAYVPPANAYVQPAPVYVQSAPVYVYSSPAYAYDYYPYSYSYYGGYRGYSYPCYSGGYVGYPYPAVSLSFGFGSGHRGGGHHGGRR